MGELLALRWRDVDFAARGAAGAQRHLGGEAPRSRAGRVVPIVDEVATRSPA